MRKIARIALLILLALGAAGFPAPSAKAAEPLLMEGKKTLYQRIITHPGAALHEHPGAAAQAKVVPFTVMYVYDRRNVGGHEWVQAATNTTGMNLAWLSKELVSDWKQSLALLFAERAGRDPLLFFKTPADLDKIVTKGGIGEALADLARKINDGKTPPESLPVAAMEPSDEEGAVSYQRFYLMPIFSYLEPYKDVKFLEVASIDPGTAEESKAEGGGHPTSAIAFVIDTTISMRPYIEKSLDITRSIYDEIVRQNRGDNVALGVVAFRNSLEATPQLEYSSKVISPLRKANDRAAFEQALSQVREAKVSTHSFNEDSSQGILTAINELDWKPYAGRIIILITDAGPLPITDPYQSARMNTKSLAGVAAAKEIQIITIHIKSAEGRQDHDYAREAYQQLAPLNSSLDTYVPLEVASPTAGADGYYKSIDRLINDLSKSMFGEYFQVAISPSQIPAADGSLDHIGYIGSQLGHSIRLKYLGLINQTRAPKVVRSWIADLDLGLLDQSREAGQIKVSTVKPAVLLTKHQLSILRSQLKIFVDQADQSMLTSQDFFQNIISLSGQMVNDPEIYGKNPNVNLSEMGVMGEFLDDLPYKSDILKMTQQDWRKMDTGKQFKLLEHLRSLLALYKEYDQDQENWGKFDNPNSLDWLYRVPLEMLP